MINQLSADFQARHKLTKRACYVELEKNGKRVRIDGLNVKFSISENQAGRPAEGHISICNLCESDRTYLANHYRLAPRSTFNRIWLYAGYNDKAMLLFVGDVTWSTQTSPPDIWFDMDCNTYFNFKTQEFSLEEENKTIEYIAQELAKAMGISLEWRATESLRVKLIKKWSYSGTLDGALQKFQLVDSNLAVRATARALVVDMKVKENGIANLANVTWVMRQDSGMIDAPKFLNFSQAEITCLLNPRIQPGDTVWLETKLQPDRNGYYRINSITHSGELRGNEWQSVLTVTKANYATTGNFSQ